MVRLALVVSFLAGLLIIGHAAPLPKFSRLLKMLSAGAESTASADSNDPDGEVSASSAASSTMGLTVAEALASTQIVEEAASEVMDMWLDFQMNVTENATCDEVIAAADVAVDSHVVALAEVYSSAFGTVTVEGTGSGCVDAMASGDATAPAYLQIIIDLIVEVNFPDEDPKDGAFARAYGNLVGAAVATAWAEAFVSGCAAAENGSSFILAEQNSFGRATAVPAITAFAWAEAGAECGMTAFSDSEIVGTVMIDGSVEADATSTTVVEGMGDITATGGSGADVNEITDPEEAFQARIAEVSRCRGKFTFCCRTDSEDICRCTSSRNERLFSCEAVATEGDEQVLWVDDALGEECVCTKR